MIIAQDITQSGFKAGVHLLYGFPFGGVVYLEVGHDWAPFHRDRMAASKTHKHPWLLVDTDAKRPQ